MDAASAQATFDLAEMVPEKVDLKRLANERWASAVLKA